MTTPQSGSNPGSTKGPPAPSGPKRLTKTARTVTPQDEPVAGFAHRVLRRLNRAHKTILVGVTLGIVIAIVVTIPPLPWPMGALQQLLRPMFGYAGGPDTHLVAVVAQALVVVGGAVMLWVTISWRLGKFATLPLIAFLVVAGTFLFHFNRTPTRTLWGWIVIAVVCITFIAYYRKGQFGYTRAATAAVLAHLTVLLFFLSLPFALIAVLGGTGQTGTGDGIPPDTATVGGGVLPGASSEVGGQAQSNRECSLLEMTSAGCPEDPSGPPIDLSGADLPAHDVRAITADGRIEVATDATSPAELRAIFDRQRAILDPRMDGTYPALETGWWVYDLEAEAFHEASRELHTALYKSFGPDHPTVEVRIRCASVPDLPGVDPMLATGVFALSEQGAEQIGLASSNEVLFETADRSDCRPLPAPEGAVTADEMIAAAQRAGLRVTNPHEGSRICYALGCLQQTTTDQFTVTVWPTEETAQMRVDSPNEVAVPGFLAGGWVGAIAAGNLQNLSFNIADPGLLVEPFTTVHLGGRNLRVFEEGLSRPCTDRGSAVSGAPCRDAYMDVLTSVTLSLEEAAQR